MKRKLFASLVVKCNGIFDSLKSNRIGFGLVVVLLLFNGTMQGQTLNYTFAKSSGTYTAISGGTTHYSGAACSTDAVTAAVTIPSFVFNGTAYTSIRISNNGFITFGSTAPATGLYNPIAATTTYNGAIAGYGYDLVASTVSGTTPEIMSTTIGPEFVIQYKDVARTTNPGSDRMNFQIRLNTSTNEIKIVYGTCATGATSATASNFGQVGLRGFTNAIAKNLQVNGSGNYDTWAKAGGAGNNGSTALLAPADNSAGPNVMRYTSACVPVSGQTYSWTPIGSTFYQTLPYSQNFDSWTSALSINDVPSSTGVISTPATGNLSWRNTSETTANSLWNSTSGQFTGPTQAGSGSATFNQYNGTNGTKGYLDFYLNFSTTGAKQATFYVKNPGTTTANDVLNVLFSTDGGATFLSVGSYAAPINSWTLQTIALGSATSANCILRFEGVADWGTALENLGIDELNISIVAPCITPDAPTLATNTITSTGLNLTITPPMANVPTGGYLVVRSTNATAPTLTNGTTYIGGGVYTVVSNGTSTTISQTGLTSNTHYYYHVFSQNTSCTGTPFYSSVTTLSQITCAEAPTGLGASSITSNGANFTWTTAAGGGTNAITSTLNIYSNSSYSTLVTSVSPATSVQTLTTLSPSATYWYQVINSNGTCSSSANGGSFTTLCGAVTTFPFNEIFASYLPGCWLEGDAGVSLVAGPATTGGASISDWVEDGFLNNTTTGAAKINIDSNNGSEWLITPQITIPATGTYRVKYNVGATQYNTSTAPTTAWESDDFVELLINSTGTTNWSVLKTYNNTSVPSHLGQLDETILSAYVGQTVRFAFRAFEGSSNGSADIDFFIDNFIIETIPTDAVDYANIQFPGVSTTTTGASVEIFAQTYEPGVTEAAGAAPGLVVWYSKNTTDVDPSSAGWTGTWTLATFNTNVGNNDEWKGTITPIAGQADTYYSFRYQLNGGPMRYGGYSGTGGGFWNGTTNKNGKLSVNYEVYTTAVAPNNTVNNTIDVYLKDFDGINNFYTDGQTSIWMYAGVQASATSQFQYIGTTTQNIGTTSTLVEFIRQSTNPNVYKATIKFADYFCIPTATTVEGINLLFRNQYSDTGNDKTVDLFLDLTDAAVTVNVPTLTATTGITTTTANINWTAPTSGAVKGYEYYYSTSNTAPTAGTTASGSTLTGVTSANLASLSPTTNYYVWTRTKGCGSSVSAWSTVGTFTTSCGTISTFPFTETFEDASATRNCWINDFVTNNKSWTYTAGGGGSFITSAYSGTKNASFYPAEAAAAITKFISPIMDIASLASPAVSYYYGQEAWSGDTNELKVYYRTSPSNPWIELKHYTGAVSSWTYDSITLPNPSSTYQIAFEGINNYGRGVVLDNVTVESITPITYTWNGSTSTSWDISTNWTPNGVPRAIDNIIVTGTSVTNKLNIVSNKSINNFELIGSNATSFNLGSGNSLTINGTVAYTGTATATLNCNSTVNITSSSNQIILPLRYGSLNATGGDRILLSNKTVGICYVFAPGSGTYTLTGSTVEYFSSGGYIFTMLPFTYHNLKFSGTDTFTIGVGNTIAVQGNYEQTAGTVNLIDSGSGNNVMNIEGNMTVSGGTFNVNKISGGSGTVNLKGDLTVSTGATLTAGNANTPNFNFTGTTNQIISGAGTIELFRSTINKPSGHIDLQRDLQIRRILTMSSGNIVTNTNTLTLGQGTGNTGTLNYTSGFVVGKMTRWFATGTTTGNNGLFPLGTTANENRFATINYATVTTAGRLTAEVMETAMGTFSPVTVGAAGSCPLFEAKTGDTFYWKLTNNAIASSNFTAAFTKQTATATPLCSLTLLTRNPTTWAGTGTHIATSGTTTNYTVSRSGLTAYGDFGIGVKGLCGTTKTWASGAWTGGDGFTPTVTDAVVFAGNYNTQTTPALPNVSSCECAVNPGVIVTIAAGKTLTVEYGLSLSNNSTTDPADDGKLVILDSGSLVQVADVDNATASNNSGTINMERITKPMYRYDFTYWSSPVFANNDQSDDAASVLNGTEFNLKKLSPMTLFDKYYKWNHAATTPGWQTIPVGAESMVPARGYIVRAPQNYGADASLPASYQPYTANFIGTPNNGTIRHDVSGPNKWNLLGNPYPSAISADAFFNSNVGSGIGSTNTLEGSIYLWTHNSEITETGTTGIYSYSNGDYACYNGTGSTSTKEASTDQDPADNKPTGFIAAGQSFFIKGTAAGSAVFNNSMRVDANNGQFFRPVSTEPINNWDTTGKHRIWLNMKGQAIGFNQLLVGYIENATNEWDTRFDGESFGGNQVTFYSLLENKKLTIQGRALPFNNQDEVPLGYKSTLNGTLTISIDEYDGLFEGHDIYLEDKVLNIVHDLKASAYNFTTIVGTFNDRFVLRYLPSEELSNPDHENIANGLIVYQEENKIMIKSHLEALEQVTVYDLLGRTIFDKSTIGKNEFGIENVVMNEQPLIINMKLANGQIVNKKIVY